MEGVAGPYVRWLRDRDDLPPVLRRCLGCGLESLMPPVVEAMDIVEKGRYRRFVRCASCGTYLLDPLDMPDYGGRLPGLLAPDPYIEVGAGVDFIAMLLSAVPPSKRQSSRLIDVGCGCGFSIHYWNSFGRDGLGIEPSAMGFAGEERLGIPILHGIAGAVPELEGRLFDAVLSSEVVEHVPDPSAFVRTLASLREPGGLVMLSTPDTSPLEEASSDDFDAWEALSPGFHTCVLSENALRKLCVDVGLSDVRVERSAGHLVCIAGQQVGDAATHRVEARREYGEYLRREVGRGSPFPSVRDGLAFRRFQHLMNGADWKGARGVLDGLRHSLRERYGEDVTDPSICRRRAAGIAEPAEIGRHVPWFSMELHHALGILAVADEGSARRARAHFEFVVEVARRLVELESTFIPRAISYAYNALYQIAVMAPSRRSAAKLDSFLSLEHAWHATRLPFSPGREILALAAAELFKGHVFSGRFEAARLEEVRLRRLFCRALRVPRFDLPSLTASIRSDPRGFVEKEALVQASAGSALALGALRLEGDRRPAEAVDIFDATLEFLDAQRLLPSGPTFADALEPQVRRERERALRSRPGEAPAPGMRGGRSLAFARRLVRRALRLVGSGS